MPYVLVVPCDMPFLPAFLARNLISSMIIYGSEAALARGAGRLQPLCILIKRDVEQGLFRYRESGGAKVLDWALGLRHCVVDFPDTPMAFCNINTQENLHAATLI